MKTIISILFIAIGCFISQTTSASIFNHRHHNKNIYHEAYADHRDIKYRHESSYTDHRKDRYNTDRAPKQYRAYQYDRQ